MYTRISIPASRSDNDFTKSLPPVRYYLKGGRNYPQGNALPRFEIFSVDSTPRKTRSMNGITFIKSESWKNIFFPTLPKRSFQHYQRVSSIDLN